MPVWPFLRPSFGKCESIRFFRFLLSINTGMSRELLHTEYEFFNHRKSLPETDLALLEVAEKALESAYSPYSGFQVAAALRLSNGEVLVGTNQENAAYPSGLCAERTVAFFAGSQFPLQRFEALVVVAKKQGETQLVPACPCGACRQVLLEYEHKQGKAFPITFQSAPDHWVRLASISQLLPFQFDVSALK